jgi:signal transduction histidine kinase
VLRISDFAAQMFETTVSAPSKSDFGAAVEAAKLRALYNFAYGLSHEINNPLANIATRAQTLLADEHDPQRRRKLATIVQQAFKAHEMIADLMLFAHPPRMQLRQIDLVPLVKTVIAELSEQANEQNTQLEHVGSIRPLMANLDPTAMAVAIKAIVQNGLEAVQQRGCITVGVEELNTSSTNFKLDGPHEVATPHSASSLQHSTDARFELARVVLTISDTGPGIPPDVRPNIFDPFFCGREAGRGLGLGLSKAWRIVELHGGRINVESEAGSGATFRVILPGGR